MLKNEKSIEQKKNKKNEEKIKLNKTKKNLNKNKMEQKILRFWKK